MGAVGERHTSRGGITVAAEDEPEHSALTGFQVEVARLFFTLPAASGFLLAGGAALVAAELTTRPTQDLDFFTDASVGSVAQARDEFEQAIVEHGWTVGRVRDGDTFCRLIVHGHEDLLVDLAVDSAPIGTPIVTFVGPAFDRLELAGRKLVALFDRAEARDFGDVFVLTQRYGKAALIEQARQVDAGLDEAVLAEMMGRLDRFTDGEIPVDPDQVSGLRGFFAAWRSELGGS